MCRMVTPRLRDYLRWKRQPKREVVSSLRVEVRKQKVGNHSASSNRAEDWTRWP